MLCSCLFIPILSAPAFTHLPSINVIGTEKGPKILVLINRFMKEIYRVKERSIMISNYIIGPNSLNDTRDDRIDGWRTGRSQVPIV